MTRLEIKRAGILITILIVFSLLTGINTASAATTKLTITKLANDGDTVIAEDTVDYEWMMDNLPVMGDGDTHYYHQGPVFIDDPDEETQEELRWNPEEDTNIEKDMGAVMGTNLTDLCDLVGGMSNGDTIKIKASDGFSKEFAYENVYDYSDREGPMVICWYNDGDYPDSGYSDGMRLVWFADDNVFGNWDWHEAADDEYWYYYRSGGEEYPTTTGLSVQKISQLTIYSDEDVPEPPKADFKANKKSGTAPLAVKFTDESTNSPTSWEWDFDDDGEVDSENRNPTYEYEEPGEYTVTLSVANNAGDDREVKTDYIIVREQAEIEVLYDGPVYLTPEATFTITAYNSRQDYEIVQTTPLGALQAASLEGDFTYELTDKNYASAGTLLLDNVENYDRNDSGDWYVYVNKAYKDSYNKKSQALNLIKLSDGDQVDFYYAEEMDDPKVLDDIINAALAAIKTKVVVKPAIKPDAVFSAASTSGVTPLKVVFTNLSTGGGVMQYVWDFNNDGTVDSTEKNPTYIYYSPGNYSVKLTVTNSAGSDQELKVDFISAAVGISSIFNDIAVHWARTNIEKMAGQGFVSGYPDGSFKPEATITRAEFATVLVKAFNFTPLPGKPFADTANHWARDNIATATAWGIVGGYNEYSFGPDDLITREQMAVMVVRALELALPFGETAFVDNGSISPWAKGSVLAAVNSRIMNGYLNNTFQPQGSATRAEAVTTIVNALRI